MPDTLPNNALPSMKEANAPFPQVLCANNPLSGNPFANYDDMKRACVDLSAAVRPHYSEASARVWLGAHGAWYPPVAASIEGVIRPYWGLIPMMMQNGLDDNFDLLLKAVTAGTDPKHPEYWGEPTDFDQRLVEYSIYGLALATFPEAFRERLSPEALQRLCYWLDLINERKVSGCNWLFFRVIVNLGLKAVGYNDRKAETTAALDELESYSIGEGWYTDGPDRAIDYYLPFAIHTYALIYSRFASKDDPERCARFRNRATEFASQFRYWFDKNGASIPMGRSLYYRFAHSSFWGAMVFADAELPDGMVWGEVRGIVMRNLRWWSDKPIADRDGVLTVGYVYPNLIGSEQYNSPCGPYWAMKAFLPLAVPRDHPFWTADEAPATSPADGVVQGPSKMIIYDGGDHNVMLNGGQPPHNFRQGPAKYLKFAYSSQFGLSFESDHRTLEGGAWDSMLALTDDGKHWRIREEQGHTEFVDNVLRCQWAPWPDVQIETWLVPAAPWHIRVHFIKSARHISATSEGGFALNRQGDDNSWAVNRTVEEKGHALYQSPAGASGLVDLWGERSGRVLRLYPNTNVIAPRTSMPTLETGELAPGAHVLACAVRADTGAQTDDFLAAAPELPNWLKTKMKEATK